MQVLNFLFILLEVLVLFNLLIIVHELGHFLAARWRGLKVERFGIWFGKPLWERTYGGVTYSLGCIPAGGFVALPQMAPMEMLEGKNQEDQETLPPIKPGDKIIVAFAGPLFSFLLAIFFAYTVWFVGRPTSSRATTTVVGYVVPESPAEAAGILAGDRIVAINDSPIERWVGIGNDAIMWQIVSSVADTVPIEVERDGIVHELTASPTVPDQKEWWKRKNLREIGISAWQLPVVGAVQTNSPAQRAGIQSGDVIQAVNGIKLHHPEFLSQYIRDNPERELTLTVARDATEREFTLQAEFPVYPEDFAAEDKRAMIGIAWNLATMDAIAYPGPWESIWESVTAMQKTLSALFAEKSDIKAHHLQGPVGIMQIYYRLFDSEYGWRLAIWFSVLLNVNLALLNLLPIPVLDGGHIVMAATEGLLRRRIPLWFLEKLQAGCALLVIGFLLYVTFYDLQELPWKRQKVPEIYFEAPQP